MKKNYLVLGLMLTATLTLTNCAKEKVTNEPAEQKGVPFELTVGVDTKTTTADGVTINWAAGDNLNIFHAEAGSTSYGKNDEFTFDSGTKFTGTLQDGALTADAYDWYVHYPYDSHIKTPGDKTSGYSVLSNNKTQAGNSNKAHLAGTGMLLYGRALNVAKDTKPAITLKQANAVVRVHVTNKTDDPLTVTAVSFTAPVNIVGNFYVNFVGENAVFSDASGASKTATLNVSEGAAIAKDASADFYIPIKPFSTAEGTLCVIINEECTKSFNVSSTISFAEGKIKTVNVEYTGPDPIVPKTLPYENTLISGHTDFTIENVSKGGLEAVWKDNSKGITANAYKAESDIEAYLVSPVFDLTGETAAFLDFEHNIRYFANVETAKEQATLQVKADEGAWTAVAIPDYSSNGNDSFVSTSVDLSAYCGHLLQFRFKFLSTHDPKSEGRWEIKNINFKASVTKTLEVSPTSLSWAASETDAKTVTVTLNDGASGYTVTPTTDTNFTISDNGSGTITVTPKAVNESTTDANQLTLTITHKDDGELSKTVTCTQAKATSGSAVIVTYDFTVADNYPTGFPTATGTSAATATTFTIDGKSIKIKAPNAYYMMSNGDAKTLFFGKSNTAWASTAYIEIPAKDGYYLESIAVKNSSNCAANVSVNIYAADDETATTVSTAVNTTKGETMNFTISSTTVGVPYRISSLASGKNFQFDSITVTYNK